MSNKKSLSVPHVVSAAWTGSSPSQESSANSAQAVMCHGPATLEKELRDEEPGEALQEGLPLGSGAGFKLRSYLWSLPEQRWTACA